MHQYLQSILDITIQYDILLPYQFYNNFSRYRQPHKHFHSFITRSQDFCLKFLFPQIFISTSAIVWTFPLMMEHYNWWNKLIGLQSYVHFTDQKPSSDDLVNIDDWCYLFNGFEDRFPLKILKKILMEIKNVHSRMCINKTVTSISFQNVSN